MSKLVYSFSDLDQNLTDTKALLGEKGVRLAEMTSMGLPVPPGFVLTTKSCLMYLETGAEPPEMADEVSAHLRVLQQHRDKELRQAGRPLLVSVSPGGTVSIPGTMRTVLNVGLTDETVAELATWADDERFAWDSYRRLVATFSTQVLGINGGYFDEALEEIKRTNGLSSDSDLTVRHLRILVGMFKKIVRQHSGREFPQNPREQLDWAIHAAFNSWRNARDRFSNLQEDLPRDLGTAVIICSMVFGNLGMDSGVGTVFSHDPFTGESGVCGSFLPDGQGEYAASGIHEVVPLDQLERIQPKPCTQLLQKVQLVEQHYRDMCDIEFVIERGKLWILRIRRGKRTAAAAFRVAAVLHRQGLIDADEALRRVTGDQLEQLMFPRVSGDRSSILIANGLAASPGVAVGRAVFDAVTAARYAQDGDSTILVCQETNPEDLTGMHRSRGVLTSRGGMTSHAAVVARGLGRTCVCGAKQLMIDPSARCFTTSDGILVREGDLISIDGTSGAVYSGEVAVVPSPVVDYFEGRGEVDDPNTSELVWAVQLLLHHADNRRYMQVRGNVNTAEDATRARRYGAEGIGLCRTEHMLLGQRRKLIERIVVAAYSDQRERADDIRTLLSLQRQELIKIFTAMDGFPVTVRLLDAPLHEFLPNTTEISAFVATAEQHGENSQDTLLSFETVGRLHEQNPMLGMRGVRLGLVIPDLYATQVRAIAEAAAQCIQDGTDVSFEIMIPFVSDARELQIARQQAEAVLAEVTRESGVELPHVIGAMIELPRAAITAAQIAGCADFLSFGTNDLTQTTWGMSRDDVEAAALPTYLNEGVLDISPFERIDKMGVGRLIATASREVRHTRPNFDLGVCGEHGGDPESIHFFHRLGLKYVSCSPFRIPIARLEAGRAAVHASVTDDERRLDTLS